MDYHFSHSGLGVVDGQRRCATGSLPCQLLDTRNTHRQVYDRLNSIGVVSSFAVAEVISGSIREYLLLLT